MIHVALARTPSCQDVFFGAPRAPMRMGWYLIVLRARRQSSGWTAAVRVSFKDPARTQDIQLVHPLARPAVGLKLGVLFLGERATGFRVHLHNAMDAPEVLGLTLLSVPPFVAATGTYLQNPAAFRKTFRSASGSWVARVRKGIAAAALEGQSIKSNYPTWTRLFDSWSDARLQRLAAALPDRPSLGVLVLSSAENETALIATLASVQAQVYPAAAVEIVRPSIVNALRDALDDLEANAFIVVLQAGELMPRHALLLLVDELGRHAADALMADEDSLGPHGMRVDPWFKPQPSLTMMCSGLLSRGVWLVRTSVLRRAVAAASQTNWAEAIRLAVWFTLYAAGNTDRARRVAHVLTHRRADAEAASPAMLAEVVDMFLDRVGVQATVEPKFPLRLRWQPGGLATRKVSVVVASQLRGATQVDCLLDVLANTAHRNFEMLVVVAQDGPLDEGQRLAAKRLAATGPVQIELLQMKSFNYSAVNNFAVSHSDGTFICLLNDDVSTLNGDWLDRMVAVFSDKNVGIVGAKLYYPDMTTQHGGVIMGLAGLAEHMNRFLPRGEPGYMWRGVLDQELSAVTGACLLVRRDVFVQAGGLDESLPSGFNDVDLCLRVRALKHSVVLTAGVEMVHHESLSFGHHYANTAQKEAADIALMLERWPEVCAEDPFHNPNLSLTMRREWTLASPPRIGLDEAISERQPEPSGPWRTLLQPDLQNSVQNFPDSGGEQRSIVALTRS